MCKVISIRKQDKGPPIDYLSNEEALERIEQIAWDDPEAFFTLAADCLPHDNQTKMNSRVRSKLIQLDLIDCLNRPPAIVRNLVLDIVYDMSDSLVGSAIELKTVRTIC